MNAPFGKRQAIITILFFVFAFGAGGTIDYQDQQAAAHYTPAVEG